MALAKGLQITKLASRTSLLRPGQRCGLDRGHFGCRKVGVGLGWPESRRSPIASLLIESRGTAVVEQVILHFDGVASGALVGALGEDLEDRGEAVLEASTCRAQV